MVDAIANSARGPQRRRERQPSASAAHLSSSRRRTGVPRYGGHVATERCRDRYRTPSPRPRQLHSRRGLARRACALHAACAIASSAGVRSRLPRVGRSPRTRRRARHGRGAGGPRWSPPRRTAATPRRGSRRRRRRAGRPRSSCGRSVRGAQLKRPDPMIADGTRRARRRSTATRPIALDAALAVDASRGLASARYQDIATRSGMSIGNLEDLFGSHTKMLRAALPAGARRDTDSWTRSRELNATARCNSPSRSQIRRTGGPG